MFQCVLLWMLPSSFRILGGNNEWVHVYNDNNAQLNNTFATTPDRYHTHTHTLRLNCAPRSSRLQISVQQCPITQKHRAISTSLHIYQPNIIILYIPFAHNLWLREAKIVYRIANVCGGRTLILNANENIWSVARRPASRYSACARAKWVTLIRQQSPGALVSIARGFNCFWDIRAALSVCVSFVREMRAIAFPYQ